MNTQNVAVVTVMVVAGIYLLSQILPVLTVLSNVQF